MNGFCSKSDKLHRRFSLQPAKVIFLDRVGRPSLPSLLVSSPEAPQYLPGSTSFHLLCRRISRRSEGRGAPLLTGSAGCLLRES